MPQWKPGVSQDAVTKREQHWRAQSARLKQIEAALDEHSSAGCPQCQRAVFDVDARPCSAARILGAEAGFIRRTIPPDYH